MSAKTNMQSAEDFATPAGHLPHVSAPDAVIAAIARFLGPVDR